MNSFCYRDSMGPTQLFINGMDAHEGEFPYQVALLTDKYSSGQFSGLCGGALISNKHVLTAAHCLASFESNTDIKTLAIIGAVEIPRGGNAVLVHPAAGKGKIDIHEGFGVSPYMRDDIALVTLPKPVKFRSDVFPINLPKKNRTCKHHYVDRKGLVAGWGVHDEKTMVPSMKLRYGKVRIMPDTEAIKHFTVGKGQICTEFTECGPCYGDSGGPLVIEEDSTVVGLVSFGPENKCTDAPAGFTYVPYYLDWIKKKMRTCDR